MKLVLWMPGDGSAASKGQVDTELLAVESDVITMPLAQELAGRLRAGMAHLKVADPTLSNEGKTVNIRVGSDVSPSHVQTGKNSIRQIITEGLQQKGVTVPLR